MPELNRIVIVGASLAGLRAVTALRRAKYTGEIVLIGAEPHLPYDRPPLSKQILLGQWEPERAALTTAEELAKLDIAVRLGTRAAALDAAAKRLTLAGGEDLSFDALVIATGATPRRLPGQPDLAGVHTLRTLDDSLAIRAAMERGARVVVVGAGFIGSEVAAAGRMRGLPVTVVEPLSQPLERSLGPTVGAAAGALHRSHGADLRLGTGVTAIEGAGRVERVRTTDGATIPADLVVVGIGVAPETGWLEGSGLTLRDGVVADMFLEAAPGISAAGDVCRWTNPLFGEEMRVEHWTNAADHGMAAARNILAERDQRKPYTPVPYVWSDQYETSIMVVGRPRGTDEVLVKHGSLESGQFVALYCREGLVRGAVAFNMPRELGDYRRLIANRATRDEALAHVVETGE